MVGVQVADEHRVDVADPLPEQLHAQLGRRVDQEDVTAALEGEAVPLPLVLWIVRSANGAVATDDRYAKAGPGAEKAKAHGQSDSIRTMLVVRDTWKGTPAVTTILSPSRAMLRRSSSVRADAHMFS